MHHCGKAVENRPHIVGEREVYEEPDVLEMETRKIDKCDTEKFGTPAGGGKTVAILGDRWPQTAKQIGDKISKKFLCYMWKKRSERPIVGGVSLLGAETVFRLERDVW